MTPLPLCFMILFIIFLHKPSILVQGGEVIKPPGKLNGKMADAAIPNCFSNAVGVASSSKIPDKQMTASTYYSSGFKPANGRLNRGSSWCTRTPSRTDEWLQVDLGQIFEVCGVATQGAKRYNEWVIEFKLSYSQDGKYWTFYKDGKSLKETFRE
ncbi:hypothetical protein ACROYT_G015746 [Oculina patagonica]